MTIGQWNGIYFQVAGSSALLFGQLKMTAESETEDKEEGAQKYVSAKSGKPIQLTMTIFLNAALGAAVKETAMKILNAAQRSGQDYLYIGGKKVFPFKLMLVKAEVEEAVLAPGGSWVSANIGVTFKQSTKEWISGAYSPPQTTTSSASSSASTTNGSTATNKSPLAIPFRNVKSSIDNEKTTAQKVANVVSTISKAKSVPSAVHYVGLEKAVSNVASIFKKK